MFSIKLFLYLLVISLCGCDAYRRSCPDCTVIRSCPAALKKAKNLDEKTKVQFAHARCGTVDIKGVKHPKICCSHFDIDVRVGYTEDSSSTQNANPKLELLPQQCGHYVDDHIYGGSVAKLREFPWMALISRKRNPQTGSDFSCGGTIISPWYILTAAHCVVKKRVFEVRVGEFDLNSKIDSQGEYPHVDYEQHIQNITIEAVIAHQSYNKETKDNDIALLRLKEAINFGFKNVGPICLPLQEELRNLVLDNKIATITGWGTTETGYSSNLLQKAKIPIIADSVCQGYYDEYSDVKTTKICAGEVGRDSCHGDSGGPLMLQQDVNGMEKMVQYGIISYGPDGCGSEIPGVYTDVTKYIDWILDNITV